MSIHRIPIPAATVTALFALAMTSAAPPIELSSSSRLWVSGTSTVRSFECAAKTLDAKVEAAMADAISAVLAGERGVGAVELRVPAADLDCNNGTMNGHMYKAIKSAEHPNIVFRLASYEVERAEAGVVLTMRGTLALGGADRPIVLNARAVPAHDGQLKVTGAYELNMKDYGLKPPTLMLGTLKVNEKVNVQFELFLTP